MKQTEQKFFYMGCGHHRMAGFIHVEISIGKSKSGPPDVLADITRRMPLEGGCADLIFSRATLEHLTYRELINHLLECYRILKIGGCIRMLVPDFNIMIKEYENKIYNPDMEKNPDFPNENYVDSFVANILYHDHYYLHSFDTLKRALEKTGFISIREKNPGDTMIKSAAEELLKAEIGCFGEIIIEAVKGDAWPVVSQYKLDCPRNFLNRILAKYFNIKIYAFRKRKPIFPSLAWFKEKLVLRKKINFHELKHRTGSHGQECRSPKHEDELDLALE